MVELGKTARTLSWTLAVTSIIKCQWGIGMMAIPFMLQQGGLYFGMAQFIAAMFLTADGILRLIAVKSAILERAEPLQQLQHDSSTTPCARSVPFVTEDWLDMTGADALEQTTASMRRVSRYTEQQHAAMSGDVRAEQLDYCGTIREVLGWKAEALALFTIVVSSYGSNIAYVLFIAENLKRFLPDDVGLAEWEWALMCLPPWLLLATAEDVQFLAPFGVLGIVFALGFEGVMLYNLATEVSWQELLGWMHDTPLIQPATVPIAISVAAFCNEGIVLMALSVQQQMRSPARFPSAMAAALTVFATLYLLVGIAGFALFGRAGQSVPSPISDAFDATPLHIAAVSLYALQLVPTYSIVMWLSYSAVENAYLRFRKITIGSVAHRRLKWRAFVPARFLAVGLSALVALTITDFGDFVALIGAFANALGIYLFPHLCWLRVFGAQAMTDRSPQLLLQFGMSVVAVLFACALAVDGTRTSIESMLDGNRSSS